LRFLAHYISVCIHILMYPSFPKDRDFNKKKGK
jgi:hypothetical protein